MQVVRSGTDLYLDTILLYYKTIEGEEEKTPKQCFSVSDQLVLLAVANWQLSVSCLCSCRHYNREEGPAAAAGSQACIS